LREKKIGTWRDGLRDIVECLNAKREAMTERDPELSEKVRTFFEARKKKPATATR